MLFHTPSAFLHQLWSNKPLLTTGNYKAVLAMNLHLFVSISTSWKHTHCKVGARLQASSNLGLLIRISFAATAFILSSKEHPP